MNDRRRRNVTWPDGREEPPRSATIHPRARSGKPAEFEAAAQWLRDNLSTAHDGASWVRAADCPDTRRPRPRRLGHQPTRPPAAIPRPTDTRSSEAQQTFLSPDTRCNRSHESSARRSRSPAGHEVGADDVDVGVVEHRVDGGSEPAVLDAIKTGLRASGSGDVVGQLRTPWAGAIPTFSARPGNLVSSLQPMRKRRSERPMGAGPAGSLGGDAARTDHGGASRRGACRSQDQPR